MKLVTTQNIATPVGGTFRAKMDEFALLATGEAECYRQTLGTFTSGRKHVSTDHETTQWYLLRSADDGRYILVTSLRSRSGDTWTGYGDSYIELSYPPSEVKAIIGENADLRARIYGFADNKTVADLEIERAFLFGKTEHWEEGAPETTKGTGYFPFKEAAARRGW